jgi:hypothetical protein
MTEPAAAPDSPEPQPRPPGRGRRWRRVLIGLLVLLLLLGGLLVLAPTLLSTGPGRNAALSLINARLNGRAEVTGWSLAWTRGMQIDALRLLDTRDRVVIEARDIRTGLTLLDAVRGRWDIGETDIARLTLGELRFLPDGDTNVQRVFSDAPPDPADPDEPLDLPLLRGRLNIASLEGAVVHPKLGQSLHIDAGSLRIAAADFGQPITHALDLTVRLGSGRPGTVALRGELDPLATEVLQMLRSLELQFDHPEAETLWALVEPHLAAEEGELPPPRITRGMASINVSLAQRGQQTQITAGGTLDNLFVLRGEQPILEDDRLEFRHDVQLDLASERLTIGELMLALRGSEAIAVSVTGAVSDYSAQRNLHDIVITADYELETLIALLQPFLPEAMHELQAAGRAQRTFTVEGSLPADLEFAEAMQQLVIAGSLLIPQAEFRGLNIAGLDPSFVLRDGILHAEETEAACNEGLLRLPRAQIDLRGDVPLLTAQAVQLLQDVSVNPVVADTLLGPYFNPMFIDPQQAGGRLSVQLLACENLPLGELMFEPSPANIGRAELLLSLADVNIGSEIVGRFLARSHIEGQIPEARVSLVQGRLRHEMVLQIEQRDIRFAGDMRLADLHYTRLDVSLPREQLPSWLRQQLGGDVWRNLPEQLTLPFTGPVTNLRLSADFVPRLTEQAIQRGLLERLPLQRRQPAEEGQEDAPPRPDPVRQMMERLLERR